MPTETITIDQFLAYLRRRHAVANGAARVYRDQIKAARVSGDESNLERLLVRERVHRVRRDLYWQLIHVLESGVIPE